MPSGKRNETPPPPAGTAGCGLSEVIDYQEQRLSPARQLLFAEHLAGCPRCRQALVSANTVLPAVRRLVRSAADRQDFLPQDFFPGEEAAVPRGPSGRFWLPLLGVLLVLALVAGLQLCLVTWPSLTHPTAAPATTHAPAH